MIHFDKKTTKVLRTIYRSPKGITYRKLLKKAHIYDGGWFSDFANLIYSFHKEGYISCENPNEVFSVFEETGSVMCVSPDALFLAKPKANELIQSGRTNFVRWFIPTLISIFALIVATISLVIQFV